MPRVWVPPGAHLFIVAEGARPTAGGARFSLADTDEVVLARGDERRGSREPEPRRLTVRIPDRKISARHARLVRHLSGWRLEDLGSTNGTFVNGQRASDQVLNDGDFIATGRTVLRIRLEMPTPEDTPATADGKASSAHLKYRTLVPALAGELEAVGRIATSSVPVLLLGETGAGKEVVAHAIHDASKRPGPLVAVNCAALPPSLLEAQFFGHTRGAFSGAWRDEAGFVRAADRGTLLLDEIGDLPAAAQGALLRVLQEREVIPVGATRPIAVDVRVIAATHQPIDQMAAHGAFRQDLFARLQGYSHRVWPLSARREDLGLLIGDLLQRLDASRAATMQVTSDALAMLVRYRWPYNVRELVHVLARAISLAKHDEIDVDHLPSALRDEAERVSRPPDSSPAASSPEETLLRQELIARLETSKGNVAAVSRQMGKAPMQVYRWMQRLGIDPQSFR